MWTASNRDTSELNPENQDPFQKTYHSILTTLDWRGPGVGYFTQISMSSRVGKSGKMWALLLLALSLLSCAGADQSVISPKLKRLREASEPYSWAHLAKGTNKQPGMVDVGRMPGTNWCGKGWRADSPVDMGGYTGADRCCRHHDLGCPLSIEPSETKWGLTNVRPHTVMHCSCDERFRNCLKLVRTQAADIVGNLFFNVINIPCFVFSQEAVCTARNWWGRCTLEERKPVAVWKKPLPYWNRSV